MPCYLHYSDLTDRSNLISLVQEIQRSKKYIIIRHIIVPRGATF